MSVAAYVDANVARAAMRRSVDALLGNVGAILVPTLAVSRPSVRAETVSIGGVEEDFTMGLVRLTCLFNHTGHPVVAFPVASAPDPLSASLQLVGPYGGEKLILDLAEILNPSTTAISA